MSAGPRVISISWGVMIVEHNGQRSQFKDCKLWPGNAVTWDWNETGTKHKPGTQIADVLPMIGSVDAVVLSRGMKMVLQVQQATVDFLRDKGITVHVEQTERAVEIYNQMNDSGQRVGGVFHSTC
eukprot:TRINITY_DN10222_c0_g1_i1.p1 TRINITY_DN10222_c0_g1~~TRINITY_DN10222_c0_g1_i1.p1  ORF type:complete len:125 (-),score=9.27 TRINITY_DN10222_c0_g1_i1:25-399(-)